MFYGYRSGKYPISAKVLRKLEAAEKAAGIGPKEDSPAPPFAETSAKPNLSMTDEELFPSTTAEEWVSIRAQLSEYAQKLRRLDIQARMLTLKERMAAAGSWPPDDADLKLPLAEILKKYPPPP